MEGIVWCLRNRARMSPAQGFKGCHEDELLGEADNIIKPWAFSSFNADDPNSKRYPVQPDANGEFPSDLEARLAVDPVWQDCIAAATMPDDPVPPAAFYRVVFYFSPPLTAPPAVWGSVSEASHIGNLHFCCIDPVKTGSS